MPSLYEFANPVLFERWARPAIPWLAGATALMIFAGLYYALFNSPADYQQGDSVRIM